MPTCHKCHTGGTLYVCKNCEMAFHNECLMTTIPPLCMMCAQTGDGPPSTSPSGNEPDDENTDGGNEEKDFAKKDDEEEPDKTDDSQAAPRAPPRDGHRRASQETMRTLQNRKTNGSRGGDSLAPILSQNKNNLCHHPPDLVDEDENDKITFGVGPGKSTSCGSFPPNISKKYHQRPHKMVAEITIPNNDIIITATPPTSNALVGNKMVHTFTPVGELQNHTTVQDKVNPSPDTQNEERQDEQVPLTTIGIIRHGYHLVEIEKIWYGRKSLAWRIKYRNRDGFFFSLLWGYWLGSWTQACVVYITTHIFSEVVLWYSLGKRCSHTLGNKYIHPADLRRGKEQDEPLKAKSSVMEASAEPLENKLTVDEATTRKSVNKHRVLASTILTSTKGRRKKFDRPKRHRRMSTGSSCHTFDYIKSEVKE